MSRALKEHAVYPPDAVLKPSALHAYLYLMSTKSVAACAVRHLVLLTRTLLGNDIILYTTDPPPYVANGTLPGDALFSCALLGTFGPLSRCASVGKSSAWQGKRGTCPHQDLHAVCL